MSLQTLPLRLEGPIISVPLSEASVKVVFENSIEHCVDGQRVFVHERFSKLFENTQDTQIDEPSVIAGEGEGYEIDETIWELLKSIGEGDASGLSELDIKWLSEAGLILKTDSGRILLTKEAKTWISSSPS